MSTSTVYKYVICTKKKQVNSRKNKFSHIQVKFFNSNIVIG